MIKIERKIDGYKLKLEINQDLTQFEIKKVEKIVDSSISIYNDTVNRQNPKSEIVRFNSSVREFRASREFFDYLSDAMHWFGVTDGVFNPFVVSVLDDLKDLNVNSSKWKDEGLFKMDSFNVDVPKKISDLNTYLDIDYTNQRIRKIRPLHMDLNGISKGKFIDVMCKSLTNQIENYALHVGGDAFYKVSKSREPWKVKIANPITKETDVMIIEAENEAVSVSGKVGMKKIMDEGHEYTLLNPQSQSSVDNDLSMVVIKADNAAKSDVLAKTFFIANDKEREILNNKFESIHRIEINKDGKVIVY